jgi:hypothetical protein
MDRGEINYVPVKQCPAPRPGEDSRTMSVPAVMSAVSLVLGICGMFVAVSGYWWVTLGFLAAFGYVGTWVFWTLLFWDRSDGGPE